jgi:hypothetical protein
VDQHDLGGVWHGGQTRPDRLGSGGTASNDDRCERLHVADPISGNNEDDPTVRGRDHSFQRVIEDAPITEGQILLRNRTAKAGTRTGGHNNGPDLGRGTPETQPSPTVVGHGDS